MPSHKLNQCWNIINLILRNTLQWNFYQNSYIFIQENVFRNVVFKVARILPRPQCVKTVILWRYTEWNNVIMKWYWTSINFCENVLWIYPHHQIAIIYFIWYYVYTLLKIFKGTVMIFSMLWTWGQFHNFCKYFEAVMQSILPDHCLNQNFREKNNWINPLECGKNTPVPLSIFSSVIAWKTQYIVLHLPLADPSGTDQLFVTIWQC